MNRRRPTADHAGQRVSLRQAARPYTSLIFAGKNLGTRLGARIKGEPLNVIGYILRNSPTRRIRLLGDPFPRHLKDLSRGMPTAYADDLIAELRWTLAVLLHHVDQVQAFLVAREEVQYALLNSDIHDASDRLAAAESSLGISWWSLETKLLIEQRRGGLEGNRTLLKQFQEEYNSPWIRCLTTFYSQRVEDGIAAEEYDDSCKIFASADREALHRRRSWAYLRFRLNFHRFTQTEFLPFCLVNAA